MPRKTIYIPESVVKLVEEHGHKGESFSATTVRLIELGAREDKPFAPMDYFGSGEGPGDLGINAEKYLGLKPWGPEEGPGNDGDSD